MDIEMGRRDGREREGEITNHFKRIRKGDKCKIDISMEEKTPRLRIKRNGWALGLGVVRTWWKSSSVKPEFI